MRLTIVRAPIRSSRRCGPRLRLPDQRPRHRSTTLIGSLALG
jgi:hypothetical protein